MGRNNRRACGKIDKLPPDLKDTVDQMLVSGQTYREIVSYLAENGEKLSQAAVSRYAARFLANAQELRIAQENFRMILTETERYPDLDPAEAILRITSQKVFDAISKLDETQLDEVSAEKLLRQATALSRAIAYKKKLDTSVKSDERIALDKNQSLLYDTIKKSNPRLYN
ncbi:MAG: phage protein Gp27 family protein, partial [Eubacterium sp.]